nr:hypothetical protein Iba_chr04fCG6150 [Ipomoea batatas]
MAASVPDAPSEAAGSAWGSGSMSSKGSPQASGSKVGSRHRTPHSSPSRASRCKPTHPLGKPRTRGSASQPRPTPPRRLSAPRGLSSRARPFARVESSAAHIADSAPPSGPLAPGAPWPQPPNVSHGPVANHGLQAERRANKIITGPEGEGEGSWKYTGIGSYLH